MKNIEYSSYSVTLNKIAKTRHLKDGVSKMLITKAQ